MTAAFALQCLGLPECAARQVFEFIFHPASYLHPDRRSLHVPSRLHGSDVSATLLSQALLQRLGLTLDVVLDWQSRAHRAVLLPYDLLQKLALRTALSQLAPMLRRIVVRSEVAQLKPQFSPEDWDFVFDHSHLPSDTEAMTLLEGVPLADWSVRLQKWGWRTVEAACGVFPPAIGQRCLLKLPLVTSPRHAEPELAYALLQDIYPSVVAQWSPAWDADWSSA